MAKQQVPTKIDPFLVARIEESTDEMHPRNAVIETALRRYFDLVDEARVQLRQKFTDNELRLVLDACNGMTGHPQLMWAEVYDAIQLHQTDIKWQVDGSIVVQKVRALSNLELYALEEAIQRFWAHTDLVEMDALDNAFA